MPGNSVTIVEATVEGLHVMRPAELCDAARFARDWDSRALASPSALCRK
jgi:hypothetical protein